MTITETKQKPKSPTDVAMSAAIAAAAGSPHAVYAGIVTGTGSPAAPEWRSWAAVLVWTESTGEWRPGSSVSAGF